MKNNLIINFNINTSKVSLLKTVNNSLLGAKLFEANLNGNILCESIFSKNLFSALQTANLNKLENYSLKIVLPAYFFAEQTINLPNTFKNNFFVKKQIENHLEVYGLNFINYKKDQANNSFVSYNVVCVKQWVINVIKSLKKAYKIKNFTIVSEKDALISFIKNNTSFNTQNFVLAQFNKLGFDISLYNNFKVIKNVSVKGLKKQTEFKNDVSIYSPYAVSEKNTDFTSPSLNTFLKYINLFQGGNELKTIVVLNGQDDTIFKQIRAQKTKSKFYGLKEIAANITSAQNYQLIGALKSEEINSLYVFSNNIIVNALKILANIYISIKIYFKYLITKVKNKIKSKNIKIKQQ